MSKSFRPHDVAAAFANASTNPEWLHIACPDSARFPWDPASRQLRRPKFASLREKCRLGHYQAQPLMVLGDDMTTDHISPAGWIDPRSEAGRWLVERGGDPKDLNVYASYRGNWEVMLRRLFTNRLARNHLASDLAPSWTVLEDGTALPVYQAADRLTAEGRSVILLAGERYEMGSSRDWAAKGVALLGARAIIANSFERIHRTNLIGMGVLPIAISDGYSPCSEGISAADRFEIGVSAEELKPRTPLPVVRIFPDGRRKTIACHAAVETWNEVDILRRGGVLKAILNKTLERQSEMMGH